MSIILTIAWYQALAIQRENTKIGGGGTVDVLLDILGEGFMLQPMSTLPNMVNSTIIPFSWVI